MKKKANPGNIVCAGDGAGSCSEAQCCETDTTKCGGVSLSCPAGKYSPDKTKAIGNDANTVCCTANKNTCTGFTCAAASGRKLKASPADTVCAGDGAGSCDDAQCCIDDPAKCAGIGGVTCPSHRWQNPTLNGVDATAGTKNTVCCEDRALCSQSQCDVGMATKKQVCTKGSNKQECTNCDCCESNPGLCGSISPVQCSSTNHFWDSAKANVVFTDPADSCCSAKSNCGAFNCHNYQTKKTGAANIFCTGGTGGTCDHAQCCETDTTKCGGVAALSCPAGKYSPDKTKAIGNDANTACCTADKNSCASFTCSAANAMKKKANPGNIVCAGDGAGSCSEAQCCETDTTKCGGVSLSCPAGKYSPDKTKAIGNDANTVCCTANKNTCTGFTCAAASGRKLKASPADTVCAGDGSGSCDDGQCCIDDPDKCAGIGGVTCQAPSYFNAALVAGRAATATTKNYVCCSLSANCEDTSFPTPGVTILETCPAPDSSNGSPNGGGSGGSGGGGSGISSGFRLAPKGFVTSCLMVTLAHMK